jgi:very-short-patch-repair endonuclease
MEIVRDKLRERVLSADRFTVLRVTNDEVFNNIEGVLETIRLKLLELRRRDQ